MRSAGANRVVIVAPQGKPAGVASRIGARFRSNQDREVGFDPTIWKLRDSSLSSESLATREPMRTVDDRCPSPGEHWARNARQPHVSMIGRARPMPNAAGE